MQRLGRGRTDFLRTQLSRRAQIVVRASKAEGKGHAKVIFTIPKEVSYGQSVRLVGSAEGIGKWDPEQSLTLDWHDNNLWSGDIELAAGDEVEYKFFVQGEGADLDWQPGENLLIKIPPVPQGATLLITDTWQGDERIVSWDSAHHSEGSSGQELANSTPAATSESRQNVNHAASKQSVPEAGSSAQSTQNGVEKKAKSSAALDPQGMLQNGASQPAEDLEKLTVRDLKAISKDLGLPVKKLKAELISQIKEFRRKAAAG